MTSTTTAPTFGQRVRHAKTGDIGTILDPSAWNWPTSLDPAEWVYVRFDNGVQNYIPVQDLRSR